MPLAFDDDHAPLSPVGQVAGMLDVQPAFLRRLDVEQVVQPARSDGGQRRYGPEDIQTVFTIKRLLRDEMFSIAGARRHLAKAYEYRKAA